MDQKTEALNKVHSAGTVNLIAGVLNAVGALACVAFGIMLIMLNTIISEPGEPVLESGYAGSMLLVVAFILAVFAIFNIISSKKLRKPTADPKGWVLYTIVAGAVNITSILGILQLIFGVMAFSALSKVNTAEFAQPLGTAKATDEKKE